MLPVLAAMIVAGIVPGGAAAAADAPAAPSAGATAAAGQSVRTVDRRTSLDSLGDGVSHLPPGTKGPEIAPMVEPEGAGDRARGAAHRLLTRRPRPLPASAAETTARDLAVPVVAPTAVDDSRPGLATSFEGVNAFQDRFADKGNQFSKEPPDQGLCVGNGFVLETVNTTLRVYGTNGQPKSAPIALNAFYGYPPAVNRTTGIFGPFLSDPSCFYDSVNHRWVHLVLTLATNRRTGAFTLNNHIDLAVSRTDNPLKGWDFYSVNATDDGRDGTPKHKDCPCLGDYPHIGADRYGIYVTTNEFPWGPGPGEFGNNFNGAQLYAFSRQALTSGAAHVAFVQLENLALKGGKHPVPGFTVIPAGSPDGVFDTRDGGTEYLLSSTAATADSGRSDELGLWTLFNTSSLDNPHPALALDARTVRSEVYGIPPLSEQKPGNVPLRDCLVTNCFPAVPVGPSPAEVEGPLDSGDSRVYNTWFADGLVWGSLTTIVQVGGNLQSGAAWFALDPEGTGSVKKQGYVAAARGNVIFPAIATLADGRGAMGATIVGRDRYPTAAYARVDRGGVGDLGVAGAGAGPEDGICEYEFFNCANTDPPAMSPRWGDYGAAQASGGKIWFANEYIAQTCTFKQFRDDPTCEGTRAPFANWSTRVSSFKP